MELKNHPVIMDITGSFRSEDIAKTDFFDFVVSPDSNDTHSIAQFTKQMRTVNAFLETTAPEERETNNNTMLVTDAINLPSNSENVPFDSTFWSDKETVKFETALLEDLNKYCWSGEEHQNVTKSNTNNSDGQIYTLTVLNGLDQNATWYRPPLPSIGIKEEEASLSSPSSMEHLQAGLDIDSFLNIIPGQLNGFSGSSYNEAVGSSNTDGLIKSETYTYEDSGFADNKEELANQIIIETPLLEAHDNFNNNNNDWKISNNNDSNHSVNSAAIGTADSLLRSALQGKTFVRYNGNVKNVKSENNNVELRRVLSTPPSKLDNSSTFIKEEIVVPTIVAGIDAEGKIVFGEQVATSIEQENPSSTHNMDDILLSQLDHSFPEDFEKIKRIANEVAESVNQYCHIETSGDNTVYSISTDQIGLLSSPIQIQSAPIVTSTKPTKKYRRSNSSNKSQQNSSQTSSSSSSSSTGVRKERSLHYCSICSKGFKDKYSVNVHIRTHTGEKPFACSLCGKSFRQKAHLAKHYQTHVAQKNATAAAAAAAATGNVTVGKSKQPR